MIHFFQVEPYYIVDCVGVCPCFTSDAWHCCHACDQLTLHPWRSDTHPHVPVCRRPRRRSPEKEDDSTTLFSGRDPCVATGTCNSIPCTRNRLACHMVYLGIIPGVTVYGTTVHTRCTRCLLLARVKFYGCIRAACDFDLRAPTV